MTHLFLASEVSVDVRSAFFYSGYGNNPVRSRNLEWMDTACQGQEYMYRRQTHDDRPLQRPRSSRQESAIDSVIHPPYRGRLDSMWFWLWLWVHIFEKYFYVRVVVTISRTPTHCGDHNLENGGHDRSEVAIEINGERVQ